MIKLYIGYWKKSFDYKSTSGWNEIVNALIFNSLIVAFFLILGLFIPVSWENGLVNVMYGVMLVMIVPTVSLLVRVMKKTD